MATNTCLVRETDTQRGTFFFYQGTSTRYKVHLFIILQHRVVQQNTSCGKAADMSVVLVRQKQSDLE